ncbi:MAG: hypothetical protein LBP42_05625 [Treponema sp.]|nr:hypothetical protein [Treponema sp.]
MFIGFSEAHPFIMGFVKHALLAVVGEILAHKIIDGKFVFPRGFIWRMIVWGFNGMVIALIFPIYGAGVAVLQEQGFIPWNNALAGALFASLVNSLTFGMVLMGVHTITDTIIELKTENEKISLKEVAARTRWDRFLSFVVLRSLPFFWIPAHTVAYLLPGHIQVIFLAVLSIVLGLMLTFDKKKQYAPA